MIKVCPVILAGGSGSRLWPLSRSAYPKQFLDITSDKTMLQETITRLKGLELMDPIIICGEEHRFYVKDQMSEINVNCTILLEPVPRNTAPAISIAAMLIDSETIMLVLPADHLIQNITNFHKSITNALGFASEGSLVTFGINPTSPNINYGYIQTNNEINGGYQVTEFVEKPNKIRAESYIRDGNYFWNSGMFVFQSESFLKEIKQHEPEIFKICEDSLKNISHDKFFSRLDEYSFSKCNSKSIDYAVMEKTEKAVLVALDAGWSDLGSWDAIHEISYKDANGNSYNGNVISKNSKNSLIHSSGNRMVATIGLDGYVVIDTKDAILISPKNQLDAIKELVSDIKATNQPHTEFHREVYRPWGRFDSLDYGKKHQVKKIVVNPGAKLSLQRHKFRSEHWVVISGVAEVTRDNEMFTLKENESIYLPLGCIHSLRNPSEELLEIIEVQTGTYLGEDDIERFEDIYGRLKK
jgi:mannose-1-phosphate guanylyltransferase